MTAPRIFVGTMYVAEGDFERCIARIREQRDVEVTHHIVSNMREKEAHNSLWKAWRDNKDSHSLFVKVDADTVLESELTLRFIWEQFNANPRVTGLQAPLHDYMTDGLINGLNAFSPRVVFNDTRDELHCDRRVDVAHDIVLRSDDMPRQLIPAGFHAWHSTERQAFHYGLHRQLKNQTETIQRLFNAWNRAHDRIRGFAIMGSRVAHDDAFLVGRCFNYNDPEFENAFREAEGSYDEFIKTAHL